MPNLILIVGKKAYRYVNGKRQQEADVDFEGISISRVLAEIEHFRLHGLSV